MGGHLSPRRVSHTMRKVLFTGLLLSSTALAQPISVQLDGRYLTFDQPPVSVAGRLMVPLRGIFEALQAEVLYSAPTRSIKATKGSTVVELTLGSRQALIDGRPVFLDVPADTLGGRTMVPLRFVSESLGAEVKWNGATRTVLLSSGGENPTSQPPVAGKPHIDQVIHNATRKLGPGDSFDVILTGDPGSQASFEILGALRPQAIPEVSPGRYEKRFVIPNGLSVEEGVLVGHLSRDGQDSLVEAKRTLNIQASGSSAADYQLTPSPDSQVQTTRPPIRIVFNEAFRRNSVRLYLDQVEVTRSIQPGNGREIEFIPQFDLSPGSHQVEAEALARDGQKLNPKWSFQVSNNNGGYINAVNLGASSAYTGQSLQVEVFGPSGAQATVSFGNRPALSMSEVSPGRYLAQYVVQNQDRGNQKATAQLRLPNGQFITKVSDNSVNFNGNNQIMTEAIGTYRYEPYQNNWHQGTISNAGNGMLRWTNQAGVSWNLISDGSDVLRKEPGSPYQGQPAGQQFELLRGANGAITGFRFNNGVYNRVQANQPQANLSIDNLNNGMVVPIQFNVSGNAPTGSQVTLTVTYTKASVIGVLTGQQESFSVPGSVDSSGHYNIPLHIGSVPNGSQFNLTLTDSFGNPSVTVNLRRQ